MYAVTVTDASGLSDFEEFRYIVVYDPDGGFVTGGGWIESPTGATTQDPTLEGHATFGFVSRYKKGATVPTGSTEFQFQAGDLIFHSSSYDWLVVAGSDYARFKGNGTINGSVTTSSRSGTRNRDRFALVPVLGQVAANKLMAAIASVSETRGWYSIEDTFGRSRWRDPA